MLVKDGLQILGAKDYPFCQTLTNHTALQFLVLISAAQQRFPVVLMQLTNNTAREFQLAQNCS